MMPENSNLNSVEKIIANCFLVFFFAVCVAATVFMFYFIIVDGPFQKISFFAAVAVGTFVIFLVWVIIKQRGSTLQDLGNFIRLILTSLPFTISN